MLYTLSGPMVYALFPRFLKNMVYTIAAFALSPRGRVTDRGRRGSTVVVYSFFPEVAKRRGDGASLSSRE